MAAPKYSAECRLYVIQRLACFDPPSEVARGVKEEFGVEMTRQTVQGHDPTKAAGKANLSKTLTAEFFKLRDRFLDGTAHIPIAQAQVRLRRIERLADRAEQVGNMALAASLLEQAAKEVGGVFTNRQSIAHTSPDGSMTPAPLLDASKLSLSALKELMAARASPAANK